MGMIPILSHLRLWGGRGQLQDIDFRQMEVCILPPPFTMLENKSEFQFLTFQDLGEDSKYYVPNKFWANK